VRLCRTQYRATDLSALIAATFAVTAVCVPIALVTLVLQMLNPASELLHIYHDVTPTLKSKILATPYYNNN
jgi:hypothetical protein